MVTRIFEETHLKKSIAIPGNGLISFLFQPGLFLWLQKAL